MDFPLTHHHLYAYNFINKIRLLSFILTHGDLDSEFNIEQVSSSQVKEESDQRIY